MRYRSSRRTEGCHRQLKNPYSYGFFSCKSDLVVVPFGRYDEDSTSPPQAVQDPSTRRRRSSRQTPQPAGQRTFDPELRRNVDRILVEGCSDPRGRVAPRHCERRPYATHRMGELIAERAATEFVGRSEELRSLLNILEPDGPLVCHVRRHRRNRQDKPCQSVRVDCTWPWGDRDPSRLPG